MNLYFGYGRIDMAKHMNMTGIRKNGRVLGLAAALVFCTGCGTTPEGGGSENGTTETVTSEKITTEKITTEKLTTEKGTEVSTEKPTGSGKESILPKENEILLVERRSNGAWGYHDSGWFYTSLGQVYSFNFDQLSYPGMGGLGFGDKLALIRDSVRPAGEVDLTLLEDIYDYGMKVDPDTDMDVENEMCDYGEDSIIFHNIRTDEWIICYEQGDSTGYRVDRNARKLADLWMEEEDSAVTLKEKNPDHLFTPGDVPIESIHSGRIKLDDPKKKFYIAEGEEVLKKFAAEKGFDVSGFLSGLSESNKEEVVFFLQINNVVNTGVDFETAGVLFDETSLRFLESRNNRYEEDGEVDPDRLDGYIYIAAVFKYDLTWESMEGISALNGEKWIVLK
jgi:hypothetical protein